LVVVKRVKQLQLLWGMKVREEGLDLTSGCNVPQLCFCARRRNRHLDSFLVLLLASYRYWTLRHYHNCEIICRRAICA
jgi:hypothetical protein